MPCRREEEEEEEEDAGEEAEAEGAEAQGGFLRRERPGGSGEVDRLVAQIGATLQLDAGRDGPASPRAAPAPPADQARPPDRPPPPPLSPAPPGALRCALGDRGRVRGRAAPYWAAELAAGPRALPGPCRRGWLRGAAASRRLQPRRWPPPDDDPHRLLQQLVLSGNLIKEAVRRLQRAVAAVAAAGPVGPDHGARPPPSGAWH